MTLPTTGLGRTGLQVSRLGYGAMELRGPRAWGPPVTDDQAGTLLNTVLDSGMNLIDTSPDYGDAEEHIGRSISHRRAEFVLSSKCGCPRSAGGDPRAQPPHDYTRANIRAGVEQSLRRMRTDHLDILMVHMSPSVAVLRSEDTMAEMLALQAEGKIRFTGMSGELPHLPDHIALGVFDVYLVPYSPTALTHGDLITAASATGAGTIARGAIARPLTPLPGALPEPIRRPLAALHERLAAARLDDLADGASPMELLLRFLLGHPALDAVLVGSTQVAHIAANVAAAGKGPLPPDVYDELRLRLTGPSTVPENR
ncbi:aldo/keto reductase [Nonomuraea wenchangensis]|uniref:Predicted oxidoreductase n=1 Tax=Nonomuraea wenchangensis TaxID=568860 RepID=A0A1I0LS45_9ACTN|nr:aldo/keto reductase [Nonomuraea wenchangensis]SEU45455.1 Predicted oxidoreductase [Nonomuraea wenchangensis]